MAKRGVVYRQLAERTAEIRITTLSYYLFW